MTSSPHGKGVRLCVRPSLQTCDVCYLARREHVHKKCVFWSGPQIKLLSAWTAGRGKLRKWLKNKWKNDFPFWALTQWMEKAMGRLHACLSGWGQSMPVVAAHYKTLPIYPPLSLPNHCRLGTPGPDYLNEIILISIRELIMSTGKQSELGRRPFSGLNWCLCDTRRVTLKLSSCMLFWAWGWMGVL